MEIYEEIRRNREAGARRLVEEYRGRLQSAALLLCRDPHAAEDLVFRAFEQAIRKIDEFRPTGSFYYWIYTILLNFWRMDSRKRAVRQEYVANEDLPEVPDSRPDPFAQMMFAGTAQAVRTAVAKLPDEFREVVVLRYFEDLSTPEIAKIVGIPDGTVRSRLHYAKDALYAMLSSTEMSPDFTERLIRATRKGDAKGFFRRVVAALALLLSLGVFAWGAVVATVAAKAPKAGAGEEAAAAVAPVAGAWRLAPASGSSWSGPEEDEIDVSIDRALKFIVSQQRQNGAFPGNFGDSAAVSALAGMAIVSKGYHIGDPRYGECLRKCLDYVLSTADLRDAQPFRGYMGGAGNGRMYAHSIATLFLSEMSGMVDEAHQKQIDRILPLAVKVILDSQNVAKSNPVHVGGWRYQPNAADSDLSCSGWALMALRSAKLNGAAVPQEAIEKSVLYIKRTQRADGAFSYMFANGQFGETMSGAAILCLELCGRHLDPASLKAQAFVRGCYKRQFTGLGNSFYALYYAAQGLFQLGGETWDEYSKWMYATYLKSQQNDGAWRGQGDNGNHVYATAMTVLAFTVPYRMLPIYQRDETVDPEEDGAKETPGEGPGKEKAK